MTTISFRHRAFSGWATDFASVPCPDPWPSIRLDDRLEADLRHAFRRAREVGYNEVILWGLACGRAWSPRLHDTVTPDRAERIRRIMAAARESSLAVLWGVGIYSWGYDQIIAENPELDGGSDVAMCIHRPASRLWVERILAYIAETFDPDGYSMQSADLGRCPCDECSAMSSMEYHALAISLTTGYVKSQWPTRIVQVSTWGLDLGKSSDRETIAMMCSRVDVLNDQAGSAGRSGAESRRALISALATAGCSYGTENGWYVDPPPSWDRDRWFLPLSLSNVPYYRSLAADGASAMERYIAPLANPGAEVGFLFDGLVLSDPDRDPCRALEQALDMVFDPTPAGLSALVEIWRDVETAYRDGTSAGTAVLPLTLSTAHFSGSTSADRYRVRPQHLLRMAPVRLERYRAALERARDRVTAIRAELRHHERAETLEVCIGAALADADMVWAWRHR